MKRLPALLATFLLLMLGTAPVHAQRGMGQASGLAAQGYQADILTVEGTITAILTEPCAQTTGRSIIGLHLIIEETLQGALNLHLGPADDLLSMQRSLEVGDRLEAHVFRTDQLPEGQYIVRDITTGGDTTVLRDEKTLRPVWARGRGARR